MNETKNPRHANRILPVVAIDDWTEIPRILTEEEVELLKLGVKHQSFFEAIESVGSFEFED